MMQPVKRRKQAQPSLTAPPIERYLKNFFYSDSLTGWRNTFGDGAGATVADAGSSDVAKAIGDPLATLAGLLAGFAPEGPLRTAVLLIYGLCVAITPFIYRYYLGVLAQGAAQEGSLERQDYDKLRASLAGGNLAARLYAKWLTGFLDGVERFFGDAGVADRTLFPRAFRLKTPAPLPNSAESRYLSFCFLGDRPIFVG
jgi:hypothetical protein